MAESCDNCRFMRTLGMPEVATRELCCRYAPRPDTPSDPRPFVLIRATRWCGEWQGVPSA
jgi:hypothetical protein